MMMSSRTTFIAGSRSTASIAEMPSAAVVTPYPLFPRNSESISRFASDISSLDTRMPFSPQSGSVTVAMGVANAAPVYGPP